MHSGYNRPVDNHQTSGLVRRDSYIEQIRPFLGQPLIKVLTGIRRSGKSTLLSLLAQDLIAAGTPASNVVELDFEVLSLGAVADASALQRYLDAKVSASGRTYLLLDEVQEVDGWEKSLAALFSARDVDIVITGSNARLLSSELATYIAGRYVAFEVWPLSFRESLDFAEAREGERPVDMRAAFAAYLRRGGFPVIHMANWNDAQSDRVVMDIYRSILLRDTVSRRQIRNTEMLQRVVRFVMDNVGNSFSANAIATFFKSQGRRVDPETVYNYLDALQEAYLVSRVPRLDLRGKELLRTEEKYFVGDHSLVNAVLGVQSGRIQGMLENVVWAEMRRRGYEVFVGRAADREIDFVGERAGERVYVQVAYLVPDAATLERELAPLRDLQDRFPAYLVSLDPLAGGRTDGVSHMALPDFLLAEW